MAQKDRIKWDEKYRQDETLLNKEEPSRFVKRFATEARRGRAIDLACGGGRNSCYLARLGFSVEAIDLSQVAIEALKKRCEGLHVKAIQADLDTFVPRPDAYDLAVMINFLDRSLIDRVARTLKVGAIFIVETYMAHPENEKRGNPDFLLSEGELPKLFGEAFEILGYDTFWNEPGERYRMRKQGIAVRKRQHDG